MSKVISRLLWFRITTLCDWLTKLAPLSASTNGNPNQNQSCFRRELCQPIIESGKAKPKQTRNYFRHSIENRSMLCHLLTKLGPISQPMRSKIKTNWPRLHAFSRASHRLNAFTSSSDLFLVLFATFVIG